MAKVQVRLTVEEMKQAVANFINQTSAIPMTVEPGDVDFSNDEQIGQTTAVIVKDTEEMTTNTPAAQLPSSRTQPVKTPVASGRGVAAPPRPGSAVVASVGVKLTNLFRQNRNTPLSAKEAAQAIGCNAGTVHGWFTKKDMNRGRFVRAFRGMYKLANP